MCRLFIIYFFLSIYSYSQLKPVVIFLSDVVAHLANSSDHMAVVHKEHGKYHVHFELKKSAEQDDKSEKSGGSERGLSVHVITDDDAEQNVYNSCEMKFIPAQISTELKDYSVNCAPPPEA